VRKEQTPGKKPSRSNITTHHPFQRGIHCNDYYPHNHSGESSGATSSAEQKRLAATLATAGPGRCYARLDLHELLSVGANGFGNLYYASAIRSMLDSWHNFFFVSLLVKNGTVRYFLLNGSGGGGPGGGQSTLISWITQHGTVISSSQWQSSSSSGSAGFGGSGQLYEITSVS